MATLIRPSKNDRYYINPAHLTFVENSGYGVQLIQVSASSSCYISVYDPDNGIRVNEDSGIKKWKVTAYNNKFPDGDTDPWNIYVRLERNGTSALVVYDKKERKVSGAVVTEEGEGAPDESYYYIKIGTVGDTDGVSKIREIVYDTGYLDTYEANNAMGEILASMFIPHYDDPANPNKLTWIEAKSHMGVQGGVTMYVDNGKLDLPNIYDGLRIDGESLYWEEVKDEEGNVIDKVLKAKADDFKGTLGSLTNVGEWADAAATDDRIMVQKKGSSQWDALSLEELGSASFENVKESGEGNAYTAIELSEDKKTLTLKKGETFTKKSDFDTLSTKVTDFLEGSDTDGIINKWRELESFLSNMEQSDDLAEILSGKADKGTTLEDYGITDAYTKREVDSALKDYVTIDGKETITGEKNFTGGLNVNGSQIVYDKDNKYWKLDGDLLVTGAVTMFANEGKYTPSTIMDAITTDNVNLKVVNGVLTFVGETGGGVADSVDWGNIDGKPSWIGSSKPTYTFNEITFKPTTIAGYGIIDAKVADGVITLGSSTITPLTQEKGDARYLRLTGGTLSNGSEKSPLILDCSTRTPIITFRNNGSNAGFVGGQASGNGMLIQAGSSADGVYSVFKVNVDGSMEVSTNDVYYDVLTTKNYGSYLGYIGSTKVQKSAATQDLTGIGSINSAVTISSGDDSAWVKGTGHKMYFGGTGYANQSYYFRPLYGASGATTTNFYIQNASASSSPTFTTTHSFLSNGNASHAGTLTISGIELSKSKDDVLFIDANLVVRGAITMYGTDSVTASTIMDAISVDGTTIMNDGKKLYLNPNLELGGLDEDELNSYLTSNKYLTQTTADSNYLKLTGGTIEGTLQIKRSASVIKYLDAEGESYGWLGFNAVDTPVMYTSTASRSIKLLHAENYNTYAPKLDGTGAKGVWGIDISGEASKVKCTAGTADTYRPVVVTVPDAATQNLYYGEKVLANYATGDLKVSSTTVDGIRIYKSSTGVLRIDGDVVLSGALTMYGTDSVNTSTIMDGVVVDGTTIMNDGKKLYLNPNLELGGLDEDELNSYLTSNKYLTQTTGDARYVTAIGTSGNYLTYTKNGATQNVTVPYATNADKLDGIHSTGFYKSNAGSLESDELETFVNRDSGGYSVTYRSASTGDVSYSGMFSVLKSGAGSVQAIELIANNYTLKQGVLQVRLNVDGTRYSATKTIAFSDGNVATADTASKLSIVSKTAWGQTYWTSGGVPTNISGNMTGVGNITMSGSINSAITINSGDDSAWIKGSGHNMYFGGTGYGNQSYYFRPLYGASGATKSNLYIQNASASSSPTFTTTHSFLSNGNASHAGTLTINGIKLSKSKDDVLFIDANLVVRGAVTMYGTNSVTASTIMDGILVDDSTIIKDPTTKKLMINPDLELVGGLDETALANYLTTNKYLTQTTGDTRYVTALGIDSNNLTWTKNGVVNNITVPYATTAKELTSYSAITFSKSDNTGKPCYLLIADVTSWYNVSSGATAYGVAGFVYGYRNGAWPAYSMNIAARCSYGKGYYSLNSSLKSIIEPMVVSYNSKYYLALYLQGSNRTFNFIGGKDNLLSSFTELQCSDWNGTYSGLSVVYKGSATGTSSKADSLSTSRTISISGHATGSGSFDGSSDLGINIAIPTRNVYINGTGYTVHSTITTDTTGVYAPTSGGTSGYVLKANGATSIPTWVAQSSLSVGTASKLSTERTIWGQSFDGTASVSGNMTGVGSISMSGALSGATTGTFSSTLSGNEVVISNSGGTTSGHLRFSSASANYIAIPTGGTLAVNLDGSMNAAGSDLIVRDGAVHPGTSGSTSLGRDGNLWNGLYLYGGSTSSAFNKFGINFGADVARISANSSGGLGVYAIGDLSKIYLRAGCTTSGASSTGLVVDADGNVEITGNLLVQGGITMYGTGENTSGITSDLIPETTATYNLGNEDSRWLGVYSNTGNFSGAITMSGTTGSDCSISFTRTHSYIMFNTSINFASGTATGTDTIMRISSNGYVGINTYQPTVALDVVGSIKASGTVTQGSDIRYKDIHKDILLSLATMAEAPSIEFHFKDDEQKSTHIGTSAQYWQSVSGVVTEDSEGRLGMDYSSLGVVMGISLAKELSRFENDTDRRIRLLEEENKRLKKEIEQLKTA